jgi:hypothetical protein
MLSNKLSSLLISLPLMALPVGIFAAPPAMAAGAAEEAVRLLTKARTADQKCHYLSRRERANLASYTARAEAAAASQSSAARASAAAEAGRRDGMATSCSPELQSDVQDTVEAARQAIAAADQMEPRDEPLARPRRAMRQRDEDIADEPVMRRGRGELGFYDRVVSAYYLERQCRSLSRRQDERFWRSISRLHRATVAANGKCAVAQIMRKAESDAANSSCSSNVVARIEAGFREVSSR